MTLEVGTTLRRAMSPTDAYLSTNIRCEISPKNEIKKLHRGGTLKSRTYSSL